MLTFCCFFRWRTFYLASVAGTTSFSITLTKTCFSGTHLFKNKINAVFFTIQNKIYVMDSPNFPIILCHINLWLPRGSDGREPAQLALVVKSPPANAGNIRDVGFISGWGRSPGGGHATHSSILAWRFPMDRGAWQVWSMGSQSQTQLKRLSTCILISSSIL